MMEHAKVRGKIYKAEPHVPWNMSYDIFAKGRNFLIRLAMIGFGNPECGLPVIWNMAENSGEGKPWENL